MVSGFVPRDGANGTTNLASTGRTTLPAWAARAYNRSATLTSGQYGPTVGTTFPLRRYLEDNDYLGDLGQTNGVTFDLDEYNGRFCVTPEFPNGTYAYFVAITSNGLPAFPYNVGRRYYGTPGGGTVTDSRGSGGDEFRRRRERSVDTEHAKGERRQRDVGVECDGRWHVSR